MVYMKKIVFYIFLLVLLYSCDKGFYEESYIINHCSDRINVKVIYAVSHPSMEFNVAAYSTYLWDSGDMGYGKHPRNFINSELYENILVIKNGVVSKINYVNPEMWEFIEYEKNKFRSYLTINPEDFE